jgi:hypothetical protein
MHKEAALGTANYSFPKSLGICADDFGLAEVKCLKLGQFLILGRYSTGEAWVPIDRQNSELGKVSELRGKSSGKIIVFIPRSGERKKLELSAQA